MSGHEKSISPAAAAALGIVGAAALAAVLVLSGLMACVLPSSTWLLSSAVSDSALSPYSCTELTEAALAARDYTVGSHDRTALGETLDQLEGNLASACGMSAEEQASRGIGYFREMGTDAEANVVVDAAEATGAFSEGATDGEPREYGPSFENGGMADAAVVHFGEETTLTSDAISHLDDVWNVLQPVYAVYLAAVAVALACGMLLARTLRLGGVPSRPAALRALRGMLAVPAVLVLAAFVVFAGWAAADFNGMFAVFHSLFFSAGSWTFSYESLLICMYPIAFWIGMGAIWLATTAAACVGCLLAARKLARR